MNTADKVLACLIALSTVSTGILLYIAVNGAGVIEGNGIENTLTCTKVAWYGYQRLYQPYITSEILSNYVVEQGNGCW